MSNNSKIFKMICFIINYETWDDTIHEHACKFYENYSVHPNLMLASKATWEKIDQYANLFNPDNISAEDEKAEETVQDGDLKSISFFSTPEYSIEFCLDVKVNEDYFILVFDEDPIFDGEPVGVDRNENFEVYRRIA